MERARGAYIAPNRDSVVPPQLSFSRNKLREEEEGAVRLT